MDALQEAQLEVAKAQDNLKDARLQAAKGVQWAERALLAAHQKLIEAQQDDARAYKSELPHLIAGQ